MGAEAGVGVFRGKGTRGGAHSRQREEPGSKLWPTGQEHGSCLMPDACRFPSRASEMKTPVVGLGAVLSRASGGEGSFYTGQEEA